MNKSKHLLKKNDTAFSVQPFTCKPTGRGRRPISISQKCVTFWWKIFTGQFVQNRWNVQKRKKLMCLHY